MRKLSSRETFLLVVVAGVAALGLIYGRDGTLGGGQGKDEALKKLEFGAPPVVQLAHLARVPEDYDPKARNLFSYYTPPPPPVVRKKPPPPPPKKDPGPMPKPVTRRPPTPQKPREIPPPRPGFEYIGFMGPKDNKIAVLEQGEEVLLATIGETVGKQFKVVDFKYEMLVIGYTEERWAGKTTDLPMKR